MSRAVYFFALCLTLASLATMWLRPGFAQDLIALAQKIRAQSPDPHGAANDSFSQLPYDNVGQTPMQPVPVTRPVSWPGTPADAVSHSPTVPVGGNATVAESGVTVWNPSSNSPTPSPPPPPQISSNQQLTTSNGQPAPNIQPPASSLQHPAPSLQHPAMESQNLQVLPGPRRDFPDAQVVAKIGRETVLYGDLKAMVSDALFRNKMDVPPEHREQVYAKYSPIILKQVIETKLIYNDAMATIPKEALPKIESEMNAEFDKTQLPKLLESHGVTTQRELDAKMRQRGSSLELLRRSFFENSVASGWREQQIKRKEEIPLSDVLGYYQSHPADYEYSAQARWEELMVRFDRFPDRAAAWSAIAQMGNAVQQGASFADVARAHSHGTTADEGGQFDWTTQGSLAAKALDEAIFGLPVGALSQILTTDRGFHIVRVVERKKAGRTEFGEVQPDIEKQLKTQKLQKQSDASLEGRRQRTPVWTIYDEQPGGLDGPQEEQRSVFE